MQKLHFQFFCFLTDFNFDYRFLEGMTGGIFVIWFGDYIRHFFHMCHMCHVHVLFFWFPPFGTVIRGRSKFESPRGVRRRIFVRGETRACRFWNLEVRHPQKRTLFSDFLEDTKELELNALTRGPYFLTWRTVCADQFLAGVFGSKSRRWDCTVVIPSRLILLQRRTS